MDEKKSPSRAPTAKDDAKYRAMTPNQLVAWNLARARELRGWTQSQAAEALEPFIGTRWSTASFSQAERSVAGKVARDFDANEIVAFARAFEVPVTWFFLPTPPLTADRTPARLSAREAKRFGGEVAALIDLVFGNERTQPLVAGRLEGLLGQLGPARLIAAQRQVVGLAAQRVAAIVGGVLGDVGQWQTHLRMVADGLHALEQRTTAALIAINQEVEADGTHS